MGAEVELRPLRERRLRDSLSRRFQRTLEVLSALRGAHTAEERVRVREQIDTHAARLAELLSQLCYASGV